ncbi:predicted protein [Histoplasma capsulatum G186AR]|uniref:Uncharacterized protein n=1 Tax=Ajellomyces capsulatus (strain G186AR / H82 / ATCC MYA-2454 / RMSCC 2432) TaxID=447093 RepID=C0NPW2_AJECG|nr:uncharacterized protein HCBG_05192 [Histoplasma capsulatum G186AR]EEH06972.1 predicted protein [Histoplasma capsulatum G186AR]
MDLTGSKVEWQVDLLLRAREVERSEYIDGVASMDEECLGGIRRVGSEEAHGLNYKNVMLRMSQQVQSSASGNWHKEW